MAKTNIVFSASSLKLFKHCKKKYKYAHLLRKSVPVNEKPKALDFGTLGHIGQESYFNDLAQNIHFNDRMHNALMKIKAAASDASNSNVDITEELPILEKAFSESAEFWRFEDEHLEILAVETPFDYILYEDEWVRIIISGKIDLLVNKPAMGNGASYTNLPYDHKFVSRDFPVDRLDDQFINYTIPTESNYLIVNKVGMQKSLKPEEKYKRIPLSFDSEIIKQWKDNTIETILNEYTTSVTRDSWPMNEGSCRKFGRLCEFYAVCDSSGEGAKKFKLDSQYVDREPWDKYAEIGEEGAV